MGKSLFKNKKCEKRGLQIALQFEGHRNIIKVK